MQKIKILGYLGLFGSILVGVGEYLLHYSSEILTAGNGYLFFSFVPFNHIEWGHFLSIAGIPFYFAGYLHVYYMLKNGNQQLALSVLTLGFIAFSVGGVWISSRENIAFIVHSKNQLSPVMYQALIKNYENHYEILVNVLRIIMVLISIFFVLAILKGETSYSRIMIFFNPISILLVLLLFGKMIPSLGKYFIPILMNITHFIFFSLSLVMVKKVKRFTSLI